MSKRTCTALARLREAMDAKNNDDLAERLHISKSSLSGYYTDGIPSAQLLKAVERGYNHKWINTGKGFKFLVPSSIPNIHKFPYVRNGRPGESRPRCHNHTAQGIVDT